MCSNEVVYMLNNLLRIHGNVKSPNIDRVSRKMVLDEIWYFLDLHYPQILKELEANIPEHMRFLLPKHIIKHSSEVVKSI